jgi:hypothetical protein
MNTPAFLKNKAAVIVLGVLALLVGIVILSINSKLFEYVVLVLSAMALFFKYLQTDESHSKPSPETAQASGELTSQLQELKSEIKNLSSKTVSQEDQARLADQLQKHVEQFIALGKNIQGVEFLEKNSGETRARLARAIVVAQKFGKVNLFVGLVISAVGVGFLWSLLPTPQSHQVTTWLELLSRYSAASNWNVLLEQYAPRLTMVVLVELLAYFFLKLYKASLVDMKYFENELTMVELRCASLGVALRTENPEAIKDCLAQMGRVGRNGPSSGALKTNDVERESSLLQELTEAIKLVKEARKD